MKYIVYEGQAGEEMDVFFETSKDTHETRAEKLGVLDSIVAGGFFKIGKNGNVHCGGFSNSLSKRLDRDISSRGEVDEKLFEIHNRVSGMMVRA